MRELHVRDLLVSFVASVAQLGYAKLDPASRDLEDARLGIDSLRALLPVLADAAPEETVRDFRQVVTNLQLAYAAAASDAGGGDGEEEQAGDG